MALLLHYIGSEVINIFKSFEVNMYIAEYEDVLKVFEKHCKPRKNLTVERHIF